MTSKTGSYTSRVFWAAITDRPNDEEGHPEETKHNNVCLHFYPGVLQYRTLLFFPKAIPSVFSAVWIIFSKLAQDRRLKLKRKGKHQISGKNLRTILRNQKLFWQILLNLPQFDPACVLWWSINSHYLLFTMYWLFYHKHCSGTAATQGLLFLGMYESLSHLFI